MEGLGSTVDVVLVNGRLREGDRVVVCGLNGAIATNVRALLTPQPLKELRVKAAYVHHKEIKAAQGVKIVAPGLEGAIAGTELYVVGPDDDEAELLRQADSERDTILTRVDRTGEGVAVQASTLGSMEALLDFLASDDVKIPVSTIALGPIHKKDVLRASIMLEKRPEYGVILAFDVPGEHALYFPPPALLHPSPVPPPCLSSPLLSRVSTCCISPYPSPTPPSPRHLHPRSDSRGTGVR